MIAGKRVIVGSPAYAAEWAPLPAPVEQVTTQWSAQGKTAVVVSVDGAPVGLLLSAMSRARTPPMAYGPGEP